jgi:hypothetical protein
MIFNHHLKNPYHMPKFLLNIIEDLKMLDIINVIKNTKEVYGAQGTLGILKDFERVLDELDLYVYENWEDGEIVAGPVVNRYTVECSFMWPYEKMPNPDGGKRLLDYDCKVVYKRDKLLEPRKVLSPDDYRPGSKKGKIDEKKIWVVTITIPKKLMQDIYQGYVKRENERMGDDMRQKSENVVMPDANVEQNAEIAPDV